jgi:hypothetical protein
MKKIVLGLLLATGIVSTAMAERPLPIRMDVAEKVYIGCTTDVSPTSQCYVPSPIDADISKVILVNAQTLAQGASDTTVSVKIGGVAISSDSITVPSGTAVGEVISTTITQTTSSTISAGEAIEVESDGGLSDGGDVEFLIELDPRY